MQIVADLHLHSRYSRAVSPLMTISEIARWARKKGLDLVASGDWTHPLWLRELKAGLTEAGEGIFTSGDDFRGPKFILSTEIASIYSQGGKTRRIHNLVLAPSFGVVEKINLALRKRGANLMADGRPIIGLSARDLAELIFSIDKNCLIIPAHIWTPWYSLYGSKSGFDSIKECFGEFSDHIYGIETGLSSDPAMNWRVAELDGRSILSFSDAHSPAKLGREMTIFKIDTPRLEYADIRKAIREQQIKLTVEFYPEEGKYHYTGHRKCAVVQSPLQTKKLGTTCPVCGRPLTVGVMHRVEQLANRPFAINRSGRPNFVKLVPLAEILSEVLSVGVSSQKVINEYERLIKSLGSELAILLRIKPELISRVGGKKLAEAISKVRQGKIVVTPGFDGVFGIVKIWPDQGQPPRPSQESLF
ncbi:DNA helicase UvrD [Candidatus Shapirobacteria bacterium CG10_big_fil_rev_8_21_14_0_10_48_15]|uniref:DNA helicase UvrD n=1 Tax=Candidatus Shapirobacteria bacterium CG10_big_fil_rev_8_21_14_0_10_48_15 TaxID=1974484 RepID=A0A2M8L7S8_9BACT|nr:MAG: DNA helicase UvrD [Candidatus Shapirobacteria bacterium CG10_big_fil_rev_8_21_14_0_10_48_15]